MAWTSRNTWKYQLHSTKETEDSNPITTKTTKKVLKKNNTNISAYKKNSTTTKSKKNPFLNSTNVQRFRNGFDVWSSVFGTEVLPETTEEEATELFARRNVESFEGGSGGYLEDHPRTDGYVVFITMKKRKSLKDRVVGPHSKWLKWLQ